MPSMKEFSNKCIAKYHKDYKTRKNEQDYYEIFIGFMPLFVMLAMRLHNIVIIAR